MILNVVLSDLAYRQVRKMAQNQARFLEIEIVDIGAATDNYPIFQCSPLTVSCKAWRLPMGSMDRLHYADIPCAVYDMVCEETITMTTLKCLVHGRLENQ